MQSTCVWEERLKPPPGERKQQPTGGHERLALRGAFGGRHPPLGGRKRPAQRGVPRTRPPTDRRWPPFFCL